MLAARLRDGSEPLTFGMVYPFSGHNYELRYWLAEAGIHPDRDVRLVSIPPPLMVESLRAGHVDGFCVGEPWNSLAVEQGLGEIVAYKSQMFPAGIEKVLAVRSAMQTEPAKLQTLLEGLFAAAEWADEADNHAELAEILSRPEYLNLPARLIVRALSGRLPTGGDADIDDPDFLYFSRHNAAYPDVEQALWNYAQMVRWGQAPQSPTLQSIAMQVFKPEIYFGAGSVDSYSRAAFAGHEPSIGAASFGDYLAGFDIRTPFEGGAASLES
jgi:ABC-type nitrate/sulfonate/bicarbonate transport system substrate-binding protein